jgi:hypothetical protein
MRHPGSIGQIHGHGITEEGVGQDWAVAEIIEIVQRIGWTT